MKQRLLFGIVVMALILAACAPASPTGQPATQPPATQAPAEPPVTQPPATELPDTGAQTPEPTQGGQIPVDLPPAQRAAMAALAQQLGINIDQIELVSIEAVDWPDACLGIRRIGVLCAQGIVPGFRVVLSANGQQYEFHTNQDGSTVAAAPLSDSTAQQALVVQDLAAKLNIPTTEIKVVSVTAMEWTDSCLGIARPEMSCLQAITPGYLMVLEAQGQQYEYHTNADASVILTP